MSRVLLLLAHPRPGSYCHAVAERISERLLQLGHEVRSHDLYAEGFDPVLTTQEPDADLVRHHEDLREAEGLVVIHPNWWGMPPAILTGWVNRVVIPGVAYRPADTTGHPEPLDPLSELFVINTSDTTDEREETLYKDPLASIWRRCIAPYLGGPRVTRRVLRPVMAATPAQRTRWLDEVESLAAETFGPAL